jgi:uncharacterized membrane protein YkvA (DUF1232 family)
MIDIQALIRARRRRRRFAALRSRDSHARQLAMASVKQLPSLLKLVVRLMRDRRVSVATKALFATVALYVLAPIDLVPDMLGFVGLVDDVFFVGLALHRLLDAAGPDIMLEHWDGDPRDLGYFVEGVEQVGGVLPAKVRGILERATGRA